MTSFVETLPNCTAKLRLELPAERVRRERSDLAAAFQRQARLPGYRPGKAPLRMVETRYAQEIREELIAKLLRSAIDEAIREKGLHVLQVSGVQRADLGPDDVLRIEATAILEPDFELPEYRGVVVEVAKREVEPAEVESFLDGIRERYATFSPIEGRPAALGDFAVLTYTATLDGTPLETAVPGVSEQLAGRHNAWVLLDDDSLAPGFAAGVVGMVPGAEKAFPVSFPSDFPLAPVAGKSVDYHLILHSLQQKHLPPFDDTLADKLDPGAKADDLRRTMAERLERACQDQFKSDKRTGALHQILNATSFEVPEAFVTREARSILRDVVRENQLRGLSDDEIIKHQDELVGSAQRTARDRLRANFLLLRIAEREKLEVTDADLTTLVVELAYRYEIPVKKFLADLRKRDGIHELREQILCRKALDLIVANATVRPPQQPPAAG